MIKKIDLLRRLIFVIPNSNLRIGKSLLSTVSLVVLFALVGMPAKATDTKSLIDDPKPISEQLQKYLTNIDVKNLTVDKNVLVDFMITPKGEIIVISTNAEDLDYEIKSRLNYKTISNHELDYNTTYTLPLVIKLPHRQKYLM